MSPQCAECTAQANDKYCELHKEIFSLMAERDRLRDELEYASKQTSYDSRPCPLCKWEDGKHIEACQMHKEKDELRKQLITATEDFNTTWAALMKLEGKFTLARDVLNEIKFLVRTYVGQGEILDTIDDALTELDK